MSVYTKKNRGREVAEFTAGLHFTPPHPFSLLARPFYIWAARLVTQSASYLLSLGMQLKADGNIGTYATGGGGSSVRKHEIVGQPLRDTAVEMPWVCFPRDIKPVSDVVAFGVAATSRLVASHLRSRLLLIICLCLYAQVQKATLQISIVFMLKLLSHEFNERMISWNI